MPTNEHMRIFKEHSAREIAEAVGKEESYVIFMMKGWRPVSRLFRLECEKAFGMTEDDLFAPVDSDATR